METRLRNLYTKCIFEPPESADGTRISVMRRHTLNDGVILDKRIVVGVSFYQWLVDVAPPANLVGDYIKRGLQWDEYERRYFEHLRTPPVAKLVQVLAHRALDEDITLLCEEKTPDRCHRRLLAEECARYEPKLTIVHR